ncbi:DoxX family protein [Sphingobacterium sp. Ag1]|uniref:DoxX family protein n=1 Tax=Sphingobacterium sp. Ag1 TaxID=1643451 RepID=UPI0012E02EDD|nr:DoxX family protein [Sphingobacterium sp. Ag1]
MSSKIKQEIHRSLADGSAAKEYKHNNTDKLMEKRIRISLHQQDQPASSSKRGGSIRRAARWIYRHLPQVVIFGYAFLYMYTGWAKFMNLSTFIRGNSKIPYLGTYAKVIGYGIPALEIVLAILLIVPMYRIRRFALWTSTLLMTVFTIYLSLMVGFADKKLCHCGGVIESMGWKTHIVFNLFWLIAGIFALVRTKIKHSKI